MAFWNGFIEQRLAPFYSMLFDEEDGMHTFGIEKLM
jgi:hypothetical protein